MHSTYIFKAISRIFSWSIVKYFEPRNCFWDSVESQLRNFLHVETLRCVESQTQSLFSD